MKKFNSFIKSPSGKIVTLIAVLIVSIMGYYFYATGTSPKKDANGDNLTIISQEDHIKGAVGAKVTIVEYADFECPACKAYAPFVEQILSSYPKDVRYVFRHFPLVKIHKNAFLAASYAEAAGSYGKFWEMHDMLFEKQSEWAGSLTAETKFQEYANALGLNAQEVKVVANSKEVQDRIIANYKEATELKVIATPSFFINGKAIKSENLESEVKTIIDSHSN